MRTSTIIMAAAWALCAPDTAMAQAAPSPSATSQRAAPSGATLWRFSGEHAAALEAEVTQLESGPLRGHLITAAQLNAHLHTQTPRPEALACMLNAAACTSAEDVVLQALGVRTLIQAEAERLEAGGWRVQLSERRQGATAGLRSQGEGESLSAALQQVLGRRLGEARIQVVVSPPDALLQLDGRDWAQGSGTHAAPAGAHRLRASAPGYAPAELELNAKLGELSVITLELVAEHSLLNLTIDPPDAQVWLDGVPVDHSAPIPVEPGEHVLTAKADGKATHHHRFRAKPASRLDLSLEMAPEQESWWSPLLRPHPDTIAQPFVVRASLRFTSIGAGDLNVGAGSDSQRVELRRQLESLSLFGFSASTGWRDQHLMLDPVAFDMWGGDGPAKVRLGDGQVGRISSYRRYAARLAWVGLRWPAWRFDPYVHLGPVIAWDRFEAFDAQGRSRDFSKAAFLVGVGAGARFHFSEHAFVQAAYDGSFWFGQRSMNAFVLGGGWAFDLGWP